MSTATRGLAAARPRPRKQANWFAEFLRAELAPYPGRLSTVGRMVAAATLAMLVIMTFHLPNGALGGYFALVISRESLTRTVTSSFQTIGLFILATAYTVIGMAAFLDSPIAHFLWVVASLYLLFFVMTAGRVYAMASSFFFPIATAIPLWDGPARVEQKLDLTLYSLLSVAVAVLSTTVVEAIYHAFNTEDPVVVAVCDRLVIAEAALRSAASGKPMSVVTEKRLMQYAMLGGASLRRLIIRRGITSEARARSAAIISASSRLTELLATGVHRLRGGLQPSATDIQRYQAAAATLHKQHRLLASLRDISHIVSLSLPQPLHIETQPTELALLPEIEQTIALIGETVGPLEYSTPPPFAEREFGAKPPSKRRESFSFRNLFKDDAFSNPEHVVFALRGCAAATLCYIVYNAIDWPGINTALATCIITALGGVGSSRQKQILRIAGVLVGGFVISLPAEVYLLPYMDSIAPFALFFALVTALASWFATSSPRLSYFGLQIALAFFLINLNETYIQTSLSVARDRVVGVLLGLTAMWLIFDQIAAPVAVHGMRALIRRNLELMADLARIVPDVRITLHDIPSPELVRFRQLRERINDTFSQMNSQADAVLFEFGSKRRQHLQEREQMLAMQPAMRSFFLHEMTLVDASGRSQFAPEGRESLAVFLRDCGDTLDTIAASFAAPHKTSKHAPREAPARPQPEEIRFPSIQAGVAAATESQSHLRNTESLGHASVSLGRSMLASLQSIARSVSLNAS